MRIVIDSNVWISAFLWGGQPYHVIEDARSTGWEILTTPAILDEIEAALTRNKFKPVLAKGGWKPETIRQTIADLTTVLPDRHHVQAQMVRDPFDQIIIAAALQHNAVVVITGNADLLVLGEVAGVPILTPRDFLDFSRQQ